MKKIFILAIIVLIVMGIIAYSSSKRTSENKSPVGMATTTQKTYSNSELGLEFMYPSEYEIEERSADGNSNHIRTLVLMRTEDRSNIPVGGEASPAITIHILKNTKKEQASIWVENNNSYSNVNLKIGEVNEYVLGGANSVRYTADGLYVSDTVVTAHGDNMYVFNGAYLDINSQIRRDFINILQSVTFIL